MVRLLKLFLISHRTWTGPYQKHGRPFQGKVSSKCASILNQFFSCRSFTSTGPLHAGPLKKGDMLRIQCTKFRQKREICKSIDFPLQNGPLTLTPFAGHFGLFIDVTKFEHSSTLALMLARCKKLCIMAAKHVGGIRIGSTRKYVNFAINIS